MENRKRGVIQLLTTFYHGSPIADLETLRNGSYVTPWLEDAMSFAAPWSSRELEEGHRHQPHTDGRPPLKLRFKGEIPPDHPIYIYKIIQNAVRKAALTHSGAEYDWNSTVTEDTPVELVKTILSWQKEMLDKN
jgi:hypothetical protein